MVSYLIDSDGVEIVRMSRRTNGTMDVDRVAPQILEKLIQGVILSSTTTTNPPSKEEFAAIKDGVDELIGHIRFAAQGLLPEKLLGEYINPMFFTIPKPNRVEKLIEAARLFAPKAVADLVQGVNGFSVGKHLDWLLRQGGS